MNGGTVGRLRVSQVYASENYTIWLYGNVNAGDVWIQAAVPVDSDDYFSVRKLNRISSFRKYTILNEMSYGNVICCNLEEWKQIEQNN